MKRRDFLRTASALGLAAGGAQLTACAAPAPALPRNIGRVVVIGGGFGGATAAKYLRMWSNESIEVLLVDRDQQFVSCPLSNLVLGGSRSMENITRGYDSLRPRGVRVMGDEVTEIDPARGRVRARDAEGREEWTGYDHLVIATGAVPLRPPVPGIDAQKFKELAEKAKTECPVSKALGAIKVSLDAKLG